MIDTLVTSLILMSVSGLAFLAYKHPDAYDKIYKYLTVLYLFGWACIGTWDIAVALTSKRLNIFLQSDKIEIAKTATDNLQISVGWTFVIGISIVIYINFLAFLPYIIKHGDKKEPK